MPVELRIEGDEVVGELALVVPPGTLAEARDRMLAAELAAPLASVAAELGGVLTASPASYARPLPGLDEVGRTRFVVGAHLEGDQLVPRRPAPPKKGQV